MRATSVMRFVILGAVGFGIGWAVAGFITSVSPAITDPMFPSGTEAEGPPWWVWSSPFLSWFFAGACGGAGLGLAMGGWKRVVALAVVGSLGFGVSFFPFLLLAMFFAFPLVSAGWGAFGGLLLGFALDPDIPSLRKLAVLALAGMVGFGVGGQFPQPWGCLYCSSTTGSSPPCCWCSTCWSRPWRVLSVEHRWERPSDTSNIGSWPKSEGQESDEPQRDLAAHRGQSNEGHGENLRSPRITVLHVGLYLDAQVHHRYVYLARQSRGFIPTSIVGVP
jgi:hypothetical protein